MAEPEGTTSLGNAVKRLGKNINGYFGERIDIRGVLADCVAAAREHGWAVEELPFGAQSHLLALSRPPSENLHSSRIYISAGIHGDEPAGPLAIRQLMQENLWPANVGLWICPCLNPNGFELGRRENANGKDLNREYLNPTAEETLAHIRWLERQPNFELCLCLHEDWESYGFYIYEVNPDNQPTMAEAIVAKVATVCPVDPSELIEGRPAKNGIIRPNLDPRSRPLWPEAFFLVTHKTRHSYTMEAPSDYPLSTRVAALVTGVRTALEIVARRRTPEIAR
jgi:protein MpaA